jgi:Tfp pilus assembly protein PilO
MGLKEDFQDLIEKVSQLRGDPERLRTAIAGVFLVVGLVMVKMPLSARIAGKYVDLHEAKRVAAAADKVQRLEDGVRLFGHRLAFAASPSEWQSYYYQVAEAAGIGITRFEDVATKGIYDFTQTSMEITAIGSYAEVADFVDKLERGTRLVRIEKMRLSVAEGRLTLQCRLVAITREQEVPDVGGGFGEEGGGDAPPRSYSGEEDVA